MPIWKVRKGSRYQLQDIILQNKLIDTQAKRESWKKAMKRSMQEFSP
jgi:hypothetical protein